MKPLKRLLILTILTFHPLLGQDSLSGRLTRYIFDAEYDSARILILRQLDDSPEDPRLYHYLGRVYSALEEPSSAVLAFEEAIERDPANPRIFRDLGKALEAQGMLSEAIDAYRSALGRDSSLIKIRLKLGSLYYKQYNYPAATSMLEKYLACDSTSTQALYLLGRSAIKMKNFDTALKICETTMAIDSSYFPNLLNQGIAMYYIEAYADAIEALERAVALRANSDEARYYLGQSYFNEERLGEAYRQFERCITLRGPYRLKAMKSATMTAYQMELYKECIRLAHQYLASRDDDYLMIVTYYLARALSEEGRFEEANRAFEDAMERLNMPFIVSTIFYRALNFYLQKEYARAIKLYKKILAFDPNYAYGIYNLAVAYDEYYEDKRPAVAYYEKFISVAGNSAIYAHMVETALNRKKQLKERLFFE